MGTINRTNISDHLIRHQLEMIGKTFEEAQKKLLSLGSF